MDKIIEIDNILDVEKHIDGIDAIIFDLDDTLYNEKDYVKSGYRAISRLFPNIPSLEDELWEAFERKEPAIDVVFARHNILEQKQKALEEYRNHKPDIKVNQSTLEMLERLKKNHKLGIITDGRPNGQRAKLEALNLPIDEIIITDEYGGLEYRKPCAKAFIEMSKKLNTPFERMVYVGDNPNKDFIAPNELGMNAIFYKNKEGLYSYKNGK